MLNDLINYKYLGSQSNIFAVYHQIASSKTKTYVNLRKYFMDESHEFVYSIDGIICLLLYLEVITIDSGTILLNPSFASGKKITDLKTLAILLNKKLIEKMRKNRILNDFIPPEKIKYDVLIDRLVIQNSAIPLKFSSLKNFLINTNGFEIIGGLPSFLVISKTLEKLIVLKTIKHRRILSIDDFIKLQEYKVLQGEEAEEFVVKLEKTRLSNHPLHNDIKRISPVDIGAGFDIISLLNIESTKLDMFIEVKSYKYAPRFYWSTNEIEFAKRTGRNYYLVIVDVLKFHDIDYCPIIICNPYEQVFCNPLWFRENQSWLFSIPMNT